MEGLQERIEKAVKDLQALGLSIATHTKPQLQAIIESNNVTDTNNLEDIEVSVNTLNEIFKD